MLPTLILSTVVLIGAVGGDKVFQSHIDHPECPKVDPKDHTVLLHYPGDCTKFYKCDHGKAIPWLCPAGTHFSKKNEACTWPHIAKCEATEVATPPPPPPPITECPKVDPKDRTIMLPYPGNCNKFYMCNHGKAIPWDCPGGSHFNPKLSICDYPHKAGCSQPTPTVPPTPAPTIPPNQCPRVDPKDYTIMFPHPDNCNKYFMCNHGKAIPWACPAGTHFHAKLSVCVWPSISGCVDGKH